MPLLLAAEKFESTIPLFLFVSIPGLLFVFLKIYIR